MLSQKAVTERFIGAGGGKKKKEEREGYRWGEQTMKEEAENSAIFPTHLKKDR